LIGRAGPGIDTRFAQALANMVWIRALGRSNRLILRGDAGITSAQDFSKLPPQLRFFAGGDRSIRGYAYQAIGPRNSYGLVVGGKRLLVGSATVEHYFTRDWGIAAFVDSGDAFNGTAFHARTGAGVGLRWRSPVGMVRVDVGVPIANPYYHGPQLHIVIGPDRCRDHRDRHRAGGIVVLGAVHALGIAFRAEPRRRDDARPAHVCERERHT